MFRSGDWKTLVWRLGFFGMSLVCVAVASADPVMTDPTRPPVVLLGSLTRAPGEVSLRLDSVLISPFRRVAVINGTRVHVGDEIGGATVASIDEGSVSLIAEGKTRLLKKSALPDVKQ